ncbi:hypothetical protein FDO65_09810 [Nakamurella flava]|uniref:Uncharacterized protein n=1 Tax=Nakamurella flava TaxID=2576308 RepID=A0A4U6QMJ7_9ACTN|nr:hypothetical protein FDO65_09810 [Nakamurella flava]
MVEVNEPVDADPGHAAEPDRAAAERRRQARRRRELDQMFGEVLPETTRDESGPDGRANGPSDRDRWYSENRPPHHG